MNRPAAERNIFRRGGSSVTLFMGAVICVSACGGNESSEAAASGGPEAGASPEAAAARGAGSIAPLGTGFIMVSELFELHLDEPSYLEESDCLLRASALGDAEEYAGCMEIPPTAICLQVTVGFTEADTWWECFVEPVSCENRAAEHDMLWQLVKDAREILRPCAQTELASVFGV
jgi:hypothetical protein